MRRLTMWLVSASALAACSPAADKNAESRTGDTTSAAAPASAGPMAIVTVLYNQPKDTAAFEKYYASSHLPLVQANQQEIGFVRADLTKFSSTADGKKPPFYRQAELYFNSMDDLKKGMGTAGFKKVADDLGMKFGSSAPYVRMPSLRQDHTVTSGQKCPCSYPSRHTAAAASSRTVLGTLMPERDTRYRAAEAQIDYSRVYIAGHFPGDIRAGALLGDVIGGYFLARNGIDPAQLA